MRHGERLWLWDKRLMRWWLRRERGNGPDRDYNLCNTQLLPYMASRPIPRGHAQRAFRHNQTSLLARDSSSAFHLHFIILFFSFLYRLCFSHCLLFHLNGDDRHLPTKSFHPSSIMQMGQSAVTDILCGTSSQSTYSPGSAEPHDEFSQPYIIQRRGD